MVISSSKMVVHWNISRSISMGIKARNMVFFGSFSGTHDIFFWGFGRKMVLQWNFSSMVIQFMGFTKPRNTRVLEAPVAVLILLRTDGD